MGKRIDLLRKFYMQPRHIKESALLTELNPAPYTCIVIGSVNCEELNQGPLEWNDISLCVVTRVSVVFICFGTLLGEIANR